MDGAKVKLCQSLRWLAGMVHEETPDVRPEAASQLLLNPCGEYSEVKVEVVTLLTTPSLYLSAYNAIFPSEKLGNNGSFWPLIHGLARRGIYVLENDEIAVNHSVLAQRQPFREASHLALLDGLMNAQGASVVTVERVVKVVREIASFNSSKDLPCGLEDALLLWMNKISESVCSKHRNHVSEMLQEPDARQRQRNRLRLVNEQSPYIPPVHDIYTGIVSGRCLPALLLHYAPQATRWTDFHFADRPLSQSECLHNLRNVNKFCTAHLPPPAFHLTPEAILQFGQTDLLRTNIVALLAHLFWCLEVQGLNTSQLKSPSMAATEGSKVAAAALGKTSTSKQSLHESLASKRSIFRKDHTQGKPQSTASQRLSLSSYSTSDLPSQFKPEGVRLLVPPSSSYQHHLSSLSTSALLNNTSTMHSANRTDKLDSGTTIFNAPSRSSLTASHAVALAGFKQVRPTDANSCFYPTGQPTLKKQEMITASTESLGLREQMTGGRRRGRGGSTLTRPPPSFRANLNTSDGGRHSTSSSSVELSRSASDVPPDVSGNCTDGQSAATVSPNPPERGSDIGDAELSRETPLLKQGELTGVGATAAASASQHSPPNSEVPATSSSMQSHVSNGTSEQADPEVRRSVTLDKYHTPASASAAGLPVISHTSGPKPSYSRDERESSLPSSDTEKSSKLKITDVPPTQSDSSLMDARKLESQPAEIDGIHQSASTASHVSVPSLPSCDVRSSSGTPSSTGSTTVLVCLKLHPKPPSGVCEAPNDFVPSEISDLRRQFRAKEEAIRRQQAALEQQLEKERQKFHQKAFFALVQHQQEHQPQPVEARLGDSAGAPARASTVPNSKADRVGVEQQAPNRLPSPGTGSRAQDVPSPSLSSPSPCPPPPSLPSPHPPHPAAGIEPQITPSDLSASATSPVIHRDLSGSDSDPHAQPHPLPVGKVASWIVDSSTGKKPSQPTTAQQESLQIEYFPFSPILPHVCNDPGAASEQDEGGETKLSPAANNPWSKPDIPHDKEMLRHSLFPAAQGMSKEEVLRRRELQVRARLEERERARKAVVEQRRKEQALKSAFQGMEEKAEPVKPVLQAGQATLEPAKETIHFKLSAQHQYTRRGVPNDPPLPHSSASTTATSHLPLSHDGPECYTKPKAKSNRKLIRNAVCYVCLAGEANVSIKQRALAELEASPASHFMVLFRETVGFKFRALYSYISESDHISKVFGNGPKTIKKHMVSRLFKYNSGSKEFKEVLSKSFSLSVDGLTIHNEYWVAKKSKLPSGTHR